jgi:preprotein translocase subunit SecE
MNSVLAYINGAIEELRHVRWPTRQQAIRLSLIVVGFTAICSVTLGLFDMVLSSVVRFIAGAAI